MSVPADDLWDRAKKAFVLANFARSIDADGAASRAYYAAFYAVSARFALEGKFFSKHSAVEATVHKELVRSGVWPKQLGATFSRLRQLRSRGDYGGNLRVSADDATEAVEMARRIIKAIADEDPDTFTGVEDFPPLAEDKQ